MTTYSYTLKILEGTSEYVLKELLEKYPTIEIVKENKDEILFNSDIEDINSFRNLYSPTHISNLKGNTLNLSKREWRVEFVSAGINPSLAYILCMIANLDKDNILLDPFCGSSVIPITAIKYFDIKRVICTDISGNAIDASKKNFKATNIDESKYKIFRNDILNSKISKRNVDRILSNLPFGIRVGDHESNREIYKSLEQLAKKVLRKKGLIVLLTQEKVLLREVFSKDIWSVKSILQVNEGGLFPEVFLIKKM
ncbi:methyltransferase [Candidatus Dojkabacteria bacterium]|uniref:Methyltransferase n=1 Tax=Candidatus Dojkabacteria bacterium TaxID=2099670 RepID=A0A847ETD6_9BACT|nr:methyltransferase [Candidatus Dojkabacteria bacterium]